MKFLTNKETREKINTTAAAVGIIGGILGFSSLFIKNKDLQTQVEKLSVLASQSIEQTKSLKQQDSLYQVYINMLSDQLIKDIKPELEFQNFVSVPEGDNTTGAGFNGQLINKGGGAYIKKIIPNSGNTYKFDLLPEYLSKGTAIDIDFRNDKPPAHFDYTFIYLDTKGNKYQQRFYSDKNGRFISLPSERIK
ncbi:MAG TPA: hypothetical protein VMT63_04775 [Bacteroidales bacterium]|nr:hypothetical protein [Bacteroidales bacterium]